MHRRGSESYRGEVLPILSEPASAGGGLGSTVAPLALLRRLWRLPVLLGWLLTCVLLCLPYRVARREVPGAVKRFCYRVVCRIAGIGVRVIGQPSDAQGVLFAANHVSYVDIVAVGSRLDVRFVAKAEVADWPLFGLLAKLSGSVFVDRDRHRAQEQSGRISEFIGRGDRLFLFPEGTSSDGRQVLPFKSALFHGVAGSDAVLQPVTLAYPDDADARYAWYGEMTLVPHLLDILGLPGVVVEIVCHPTVRARDFPERKSLSRHVEDQVRAGMPAVGASDDAR